MLDLYGIVSTTSLDGSWSLTSWYRGGCFESASRTICAMDSGCRVSCVGSPELVPAITDCRHDPRRLLHHHFDPTAIIEIWTSIRRSPWRHSRCNIGSRPLLARKRYREDGLCHGLWCPPRSFVGCRHCLRMASLSAARRPACEPSGPNNTDQE